VRLRPSAAGNAEAPRRESSPRPGRLPPRRAGPSP
jgi:hypothetical protein